MIRTAIQFVPIESRTKAQKFKTRNDMVNKPHKKQSIQFEIYSRRFYSNAISFLQHWFKSWKQYDVNGQLSHFDQRELNHDDRDV